MADSDYHLMMNGGRPEGCSCHLIRDMFHSQGGGPPDPAEWEQNSECPVHAAKQEERYV